MLDLVYCFLALFPLIFSFSVLCLICYSQLFPSQHGLLVLLILLRPFVFLWIVDHYVYLIPSSRYVVRSSSAVCLCTSFLPCVVSSQRFRPAITSSLFFDSPLFLHHVSLSEYKHSVSGPRNPSACSDSLFGCLFMIMSCWFALGA